MTDRNKPINPLMTRGVGPGNFSGKPEAYVRVNDVMVPCTWDEFVGWMNAHNKRAGTWVTKFLRDESGRVVNRTIDWSENVGTDGYRERSNRPAPIDRYVTDFGRAQ